MSQKQPMSAGNDAFPDHVFKTLGEGMRVFDDRIGGAIMVASGRPHNGPLTLMTAGVSRLPIDSGLPVELAVEFVEGQEGAAYHALTLVCDDIFGNRRTPPVEAPWRNDGPIFTNTEINSIVATGSRYGASFDEVRGSAGELLGNVLTLRLLTDNEAQFVAANGWSALVSHAGSEDALIDVERTSTVSEVPPMKPRGIEDLPVILSKLHDEHPPRWITFTDGMFQSVTGLESDEYMNDADNHTIWSVATFIDRFPWTARFIHEAEIEQTALFQDQSGDYLIEGD